MPSIKQLGDLIFTALQNLFWWVIEIILKIFVFLLDLIASILPSYDVDLPSVLFANFEILTWLDWVFPVQHFIACVTTIAANVVMSFTITPFLRLGKIRS